MNSNLEKFKANKLEKNELYPILGGLINLGTNSNTQSTNTTGDDCDSTTSDSDQDPAKPATQI